MRTGIAERSVLCACLMVSACSNSVDNPRTRLDGGANRITADAGEGDTGIPDSGESGDTMGPADAGPLPNPGTPPDPGLPGSSSVSVSTHELELAGGTRPRVTTMTLYLPEAAGPSPVVVFLHGFQLTTDLYASYGQHLASHGFVVIMPQMPGGLFGGPNHRELAAYEIAVLDWVEANAATPDGPLEGKADVERIGLAGHSMGGKISMLTASSDARPKAVFGIDPVDAAGGPMAASEEDYPSVTPELMPLIDIPLGLLGETTNATCDGFMCQACAPEEDNFQQYYEHATRSAIEIKVVGANHMSFLDNPNCGLTCSVCPAGTDDTSATRLLTRRYMTAFFEAFLNQQQGYLPYLSGPGMEADIEAGRVTSRTKNGF
jgi:predicted dienelactone hydrolase